jgi:hypothetical protein
LAKRNHDVSAVRRIELKIGIHIGDVMHRDGDVYGDGVNIASRIEQLAGAGGICVSMDVERQIRNALEARFEKFGSADLKNISYRWICSELCCRGSRARKQDLSRRLWFQRNRRSQFGLLFSQPSDCSAVFGGGCNMPNGITSPHWPTRRTWRLRRLK